MDCCDGSAWNSRWFSIAFYPPKDSDIIDKGAYIEILKADIYEISVVDEPADEAARVINNETIDSLETIDDAESLLRSILPGGYGEKLLSRLADIQNLLKSQTLNLIHLRF